MIRLALAALLLAPSPALAQVITAPSSVDTSNLATKAEVQAAQTTATNAATAASTAQSAVPPVCATAPSGDTLNGSTGSGTACTPRTDSTRPTAVQAGNTTLSSTCAFTITFSRSFTSSSPFIYAAVVDSSSNQMPCKIQARSATGASGVCAPANSTALSLSLVTTGLTVTPFGSTFTSGTAVMFVGREPTQ